MIGTLFQRNWRRFMKMHKKQIIWTIDVEPDLHGGGNKGIALGLKRFERICDKHNVKPTLFIVGSLLENKDNVKVFNRLNKKGWEISCHGYSHKRFDDMPYEEKEEEIKKCLDIWKKTLKSKPRGFRAPQHSIDKETLDLLEKYGFEYDSSFYPLNLAQLFFFPKRFMSWINYFFSSTRGRKIRKNLKEIPTSSLLIPFVSLTFRVFPLWMIKTFIWKIKLFYKKRVFYAHSWDFIKLEKSRIDRRFPYNNLLSKIDKIMSWENNSG